MIILLISISEVRPEASIKLLKDKMDITVWREFKPRLVLTREMQYSLLYFLIFSLRESFLFA